LKKQLFFQWWAVDGSRMTVFEYHSAASKYTQENSKPERKRMSRWSRAQPEGALPEEHLVSQS